VTVGIQFQSTDIHNWFTKCSRTKSLAHPSVRAFGSNQIPNISSEANPNWVFIFPLTVTNQINANSTLKFISIPKLNQSASPFLFPIESEGIFLSRFQGKGQVTPSPPILFNRKKAKAKRSSYSPPIGIRIVSLFHPRLLRLPAPCVRAEPWLPTPRLSDISRSRVGSRGSGSRFFMHYTNSVSDSVCSVGLYFASQHFLLLVKNHWLRRIGIGTGIF